MWIGLAVAVASRDRFALPIVPHEFIRGDGLLVVERAPDCCRTGRASRSALQGPALRCVPWSPSRWNRCSCGWQCLGGVCLETCPDCGGLNPPQFRFDARYTWRECRVGVKVAKAVLEIIGMPDFRIDYIFDRSLC
jgi:hypothetical protein